VHVTVEIQADFLHYNDIDNIKLSKFCKVFELVPATQKVNSPSGHKNACMDLVIRIPRNYSFQNITLTLPLTNRSNDTNISYNSLDDTVNFSLCFN
jgi:hypothetical protein